MDVDNASMYSCLGIYIYSLAIEKGNFVPGESAILSVDQEAGSESSHTVD